MPSKPGIYWDACVFIDRLQRRADRIALLESITDSALNGDLLIVTSVITRTEVIRLPQLGISSAEEVKKINEFFENPWISIRLVDHVIAESAADLRRSHGLKTCDAIHVATALRFGIPTLHTYDGLDASGQRDMKPGKLLSYDKVFGNPPLAIEPPSHPNPQLPMFTGPGPNP